MGGGLTEWENARLHRAGLRRSGVPDFAVLHASAAVGVGPDGGHADGAGIAPHHERGFGGVGGVM